MRIMPLLSLNMECCFHNFIDVNLAEFGKTSMTYGRTIAVVQPRERDCVFDETMIEELSLDEEFRIKSFGIAKQGSRLAILAQYCNIKKKYYHTNMVCEASLVTFLCS